MLGSLRSIKMATVDNRKGNDSQTEVWTTGRVCTRGSLIREQTTEKNLLTLVSCALEISVSEIRFFDRGANFDDDVVETIKSFGSESNPNEPTSKVAGKTVWPSGSSVHAGAICLTT